MSTVFASLFILIIVLIEVLVENLYVVGLAAHRSRHT